MSQAIFKFNNGNSALLCSGCSVILKIGSQFNDHEIQAIRGQKHMDARFCVPCNVKRIFNNKENQIVDGFLAKNIIDGYLSPDEISDAIEKKYIEPNDWLVPTSYKMLNF